MTACFCLHCLKAMYTVKTKHVQMCLYFGKKKNPFGVRASIPFCNCQARSRSPFLALILQQTARGSATAVVPHALAAG